MSTQSKLAVISVIIGTNVNPGPCLEVRVSSRAISARKRIVTRVFAAAMLTMGCVTFITLCLEIFMIPPPPYPGKLPEVLVIAGLDLALVVAAFYSFSVSEGRSFRRYARRSLPFAISVGAILLIILPVVQDFVSARH